MEWNDVVASHEGEQVFAARSFGSDAQMVFILKQGEEGTPVAEICRKAGVNQATYISWKKKYAGLLPDETTRLKRIVADLTLDREMLQDVIRRKL